MAQQQTQISPRRAVLAHLQAKKGAIQSAVPKTLTGQLTLESIIQGVGLAMERNQTLAKCTPESVYLSVLTIVRLGLDPSGYTQQAFLVPFYNSRAGGYECQPIIGQQGKIELAYRSGKITKIISNVIHDHDEFELNLAEGTMTHSIDLRATDRGRPLAAYARIWVKGSEEPITEVMTYSEFERIKAASAAKNKGRLSPAYQEWEDEMFRRSVLSRALKRAPKSADLMEVLSKETEIEQRQAGGDILDATWTEGDEPQAASRPSGRAALGLVAGSTEAQVIDADAQPADDVGGEE